MIIKSINRFHNFTHTACARTHLVLLAFAVENFCLGYRKMPQIHNQNASRNPLVFETRRVQSNGRSLVVSLPKPFTDLLGILRGDLIRFHLHTIDKRKIVLEKIEMDDDDSNCNGADKYAS